MRALVLAAALAVLVVCLAPLGHSAPPASARARAWRIIVHTFPAATAPLAFKVASCESVGFTDFLNDSGRHPSYARGMFQELPSNDGRSFTWRHRSLRLRWRHLSSEGPDWYSARIALLQSAGGTDWGEWAASRSCWAR